MSRMGQHIEVGEVARRLEIYIRRNVLACFLIDIFTHAGSSPYTHAGSGPGTHAGSVHPPAPVHTRRLRTLHARARLLIVCVDAGGFFLFSASAAAAARRAATRASSSAVICSRCG
jgi:hypothetical protein